MRPWLKYWHNVGVPSVESAWCREHVAQGDFDQGLSAQEMTEKWSRAVTMTSGCGAQASLLHLYLDTSKYANDTLVVHFSMFDIMIWNKDKLRLWNYLRNILVSTLFLRFLWSCSFSIARTQRLVGSSRWKHDDCVSEVFFPGLPLVQTSKVSIPWLTFPNKLDMRYCAEITVCIIRDWRTFLHRIHMR